MVLVSNSAETPEFYFTLRPGFDYPKYLEQRSHLDRIVLATDRNTQEIIGSARQIAERFHGEFTDIKDGLSSIQIEVSRTNNILTDGFDRIEVKLTDIHQGISELTDVCQIGFQSLNRALVQTNDLLGELLSVAEKPDQTWAREKYNNARACIESGLWEEALEFIDKAISGDAHNPGFKLDPEFHFLRGIIFLGNETVPPKMIDLEVACSDFKKCERYCGTKNNSLKSKALAHAAWCQYCLGNAESAIEFVRQAVLVDKNLAEGYYLLSKFLLHLNKVEEAKSPFFQAMSSSSMYAFRAKNDGNFAAYSAEVDLWIEEFRLSEEVKLREDIRSRMPAEAHSALLEFAEKHGISTSENHTLDAVKVVSRKDKLKLLEIDEIKTNLDVAMGALRNFQDGLIDILKEKASNIFSVRPPENKVAKIAVQLVVGALGIIPGFLVGSAVYNWVYSIDYTGPAQFFGVVAGLIIGGPVSLFGLIMSFEFGEKIGDAASNAQTKLAENRLSGTVETGWQMMKQVEALQLKLVRVDQKNL